MSRDMAREHVFKECERSPRLPSATRLLIPLSRESGVLVMCHQNTYKGVEEA